MLATAPESQAADRPFKTLTMTLLKKTTRNDQNGVPITTVTGEETPGRKVRAILFAEHAANFDEALAMHRRDKGADAVESRAQVTLTGYWKKRRFTDRAETARTIWEFRVRGVQFA